MKYATESLLNKYLEIEFALTKYSDTSKFQFNSFLNLARISNQIIGISSIHFPENSRNF